MQAEEALRASIGKPHYVLRELIKQGIDAVPHPRLQAAMVQAFTEMQQGSSPGFQLLRGESERCPCAQHIAVWRASLLASLDRHLVTVSELLVCRLVIVPPTCVSALARLGVRTTCRAAGAGWRHLAPRERVD